MNDEQMRALCLTVARDVVVALIARATPNSIDATDVAKTIAEMVLILEGIPASVPC